MLYQALACSDAVEILGDSVGLAKARHDVEMALRVFRAGRGEGPNRTIVAAIENFQNVWSDADVDRLVAFWYEAGPDDESKAALLGGLTEQGSHEKARLLLAQPAFAGFDLNTPFAFAMCTPLNMACSTGGLETVRFMLDAGADPNAAAGLGAALHSAAKGYDEEIVALLVARGADVNQTGGWDDQTPLCIALMQSPPNEDIISALAEAGADPNVKDVKKRTAWLLAVELDAGKVDHRECEHDAGFDFEPASGDEFECDECSNLRQDLMEMYFPTADKGGADDVGGMGGVELMMTLAENPGAMEAFLTLRELLHPAADESAADE